MDCDFTDILDNISDIDFDYILSKIENLTDIRNRLLVSDWATEKRYLPTGLTSKPGNWDNNYTPYLVKMMNCFSPTNPCRKVVLMKASQVGGSVGLVENLIGYTIDVEPAPMLFVTGDATLAKTAVEIKVDQMISNCGLSHKIRNPDPNSKKTGDTTDRKDFSGGFLLSYGARSGQRIRQNSVKIAIADEFESWPDVIAREGSIEELFENRTNAYDDVKKILYLSTPLVLQTSKIYKQYIRGDQQHYFVPCKHCGGMQFLRLRGVRDDGKKFAFDFKVNDNHELIPDSVVYICEFCLKPWKNYDKTWFLPRGEWRPTATPKEPFTESYWLPSFYAPVGMYSWETMCFKWLQWWDVKNQRVKDIESYKTFRNTVEGLPFEERGAAPKYEKVIQHRRGTYSRNQINNHRALIETGSRILILTLACDPHKDRLDVEILGWCVNGCTYSIDWRLIEGDIEDLHSANSPWKKLSNIIETEVWKSDDNRIYNVQISFIDAGYKTDEVYQFCNQYSSGVYAIFGRDSLPKNKTYKTLFHESKNKYGDPFYSINHNTYKDKLATYLRSDWNDGEKQPPGYPNYPDDYGDDYFRMYEAEEKVVEYHKKTKQRLGYYWRSIKGQPNHAWDCRIYNMAALDFHAFNICVHELQLDGIVYDKYWSYLIENQT